MLIDLGTSITRARRLHQGDGSGGIASVLPPLARKVTTAATRLHQKGRRFLVNAITAAEAPARPTIQVEFMRMKRTLKPLLARD